MRFAHISTMEELKEFLEAVDAAETWDMFEPEEYKSACEYVGLEYDSYEDPDRLFEDLMAGLKLETEGERYFVWDLDMSPKAKFAYNHRDYVVYKKGDEFIVNPGFIAVDDLEEYFSRVYDTECTGYAVMVDRDDTDHGYGSHDLEEAKEMCRSQKEIGHTESYIAVISPVDDFYLDEIEVE